MQVIFAALRAAQAQTASESAASVDQIVVTGSVVERALAGAVGAAVGAVWNYVISTLTVW